MSVFMCVSVYECLYTCMCACVTDDDGGDDVLERTRLKEKTE